MKLSVLLALLLLASGWLQAQSQPFSVENLLAMQRIGDPQVAPDGTRAVFVVSTPDLDGNRNRTDLWLVSLKGGAARRLTTDAASDFNPRWSVDGGSIYFLSTRSGSSQVWKINLSGGEASQVTDLPLSASNLVVSPAGDRLAVCMEVFVDCMDLECTSARLEETEEAGSGQTYDKLFVRHWDTWKDGRRSHLFILDSDGGSPVDVTTGMDADIPSKPFGGPEEITFGPDGKIVVFAARNARQSEPWSTNFDLFSAPVDGSSEPVNLTLGRRAWDTQPVFSPDGRKLAYLSMRRAGYESDRFRIVVRDWPDGPERELTEGWDRSPGSIAWSPDATLLYATAQDLGQNSLFRVDATSGSVRRILNDGFTVSPSPVGDRVLFTLDDLDSPAEIYSLSSDGTDLQPVTRINKDRLDTVQFGEFETFDFEGWNQETVQGIVVKPVNFDPSQKYPVAFLIHGGPQGAFGNHFHYRWNPQIYAGQGYAAVMVNFHGSTGFGQAFTDSIRGDWGGKPLTDLQEGLKAALERYSWMDGDRVAGLGASYGGYMVNWIEGNWPDRFRCLVNHDGVFDLRSMYYSTEELWFMEWEHGGPHYFDGSGYAKHNPVDHVDKWQTPMLVIHGNLDYRVPLEQGMATFTALQRLGVESRFLYFPDENHWVLKPKNSIQWHQEVLSWLERWLK